MKILRLSTLSLLLAIAVMTLGVSVNGWAGPSECSGPKDARPDSCNVGAPPSNDVQGRIIFIDPECQL